MAVGGLLAAWSGRRRRHPARPRLRHPAGRDPPDRPERRQPGHPGPGLARAGRIALAPRALSLERGEAFFVVAHQNDRPFTVQAGDALVRVIGTRFNVHRADRNVRVEVEQGVVQVSDGANGPDRAVTLRAGQTVVADARGLTVGVLPRSDLAGGCARAAWPMTTRPGRGRRRPQSLQRSATDHRLGRHRPAEGHRRLRRRPGRPLRGRAAARAAGAPGLGRSRRPGPGRRRLEARAGASCPVSAASVSRRYWPWA